jgi:hypothetical protein
MKPEIQVPYSAHSKPVSFSSLYRMLHLECNPNYYMSPFTHITMKPMAVLNSCSCISAILSLNEHNSQKNTSCDQTFY